MIKSTVQRILCGFVAASLFSVAAPAFANPEDTSTSGTGATPHSHEHKPPHGGTLIVLGQEFAHLEILLDSSTGKLTAYALDGEAENSVRLKQPSIELEFSGGTSQASANLTSQTIALKAVENPLTGESSGDCSQFESQSDSLKNRKQFVGVLKALTIRGTSFKNVAFRFPEGNE